MKIALILRGHMRGYKHTYESIKNKILINNDVDVFISTWNNYGWWTSDSKRGVSYDKSIVDFEEIKNLFNPKVLKIENYFEEHFDDRFRQEAIKYQIFLKDSRIRISNVLSMHYKFQDSISVFETYSRNNNIRYDIVINTRPDIYINKPLNLSVSNKLTIDYGRGICGGGIGDLFIMGSHSQLSKFIDIYDSEFKTATTINFWCPHRLMEEFFRSKNLQYLELDPSYFSLHNAKNGLWKE